MPKIQRKHSQARLKTDLERVGGPFILTAQIEMNFDKAGSMTDFLMRPIPPSGCGCEAESVGEVSALFITRLADMLLAEPMMMFEYETDPFILFERVK